MKKAMPYKDSECVRVVHDLAGVDLLGDTEVSIKAGCIATVIHLTASGGYLVEFQDPKADSGWGVLAATEADLAPYVENAV